MSLPQIFGALLLLAACSTAVAEPADPTQATLRKQVLKASDANAKAAAYKALFLRVGKARLQELTKDPDTGIALQAAWELHKKAVKRAKPVLHRTNDVYDPDELAKFVAFLKERTKAPVPDWWSETIKTAELFPGRHHYFDCPEMRFGQAILSTASGRWFAADYPNAGFSYQLTAHEGKGGRLIWKADVWSAGRLFLQGLGGYHRVELRERGGVVHVFGAESHGMYLEAFEAAAGKNLYRFCTCYWFNFSEEWGLK
jgi:hypothetical protein